ncbi:MAG: hypothetical protein IKT57_00525 [Clostridia bacterium]|nr:hypothetical protein [Clostridia bacterium]
MSGWMLAAMVACFVASVALLVGDRVRRAHQELAMKRMRASALYAEIYELILYAQRYDLDEIRIERDRISFFSMIPPGCIGVFDLTLGGYRYLNPGKVYALMQVLAIDLPQLQSARQYRLRRYRVMRPNGQMDVAYAYTAKSAYKAKVLVKRRNLQYDPYVT